MYRLLLILICFTVLLSACSPATPTPAPTEDPAVVYTRVAATVYARLTAEVTATFTPTVTPTATNTPEPTSTNTPEPTATLGTPLPTATKKAGALAAKYLYTYPEDNTYVVPNYRFNIEWGFLNIGSYTWPEGTKLVWVGHERFTNQGEIILDHAVAPGEKAIFVLGVFGSENMDPHRTDWQLMTPNNIPIPGGLVYFTYIPK